MISLLLLLAADAKIVTDGAIAPTVECNATANNYTTYASPLDGPVFSGSITPQKFDGSEKWDAKGRAGLEDGRIFVGLVIQHRDGKTALFIQGIELAGKKVLRQGKFDLGSVELDRTVPFSMRFADNGYLVVEANGQTRTVPWRMQRPPTARVSCSGGKFLFRDVVLAK